MKRWLVLVVALFTVGFFGRGHSVSALPSDSCDDNYYYIDREVIWCQPSDDWYYWSSFFDDDSDLALAFKELYGWDENQMLEMNGEELVAVAMHEPLGGYGLYVQVFRSLTVGTRGYSTEEAQIEDAHLTVDDGQRIDYQVSDTCFTPCGVLSYDMGKAGEVFIYYPLREIGAVYTVVVFGANEMTNDHQLSQEVVDIASSIAVAQKPWAGDTPVQEQTSNTDHPVFIGGDFVSVAVSKKTVQDTALGTSTTSESDSIYSTFPGAKLEFLANSTVVFTPLGIGTKLRDDLFPVTGSYEINGSSVTYNNGKYDFNGGTINFELYRESVIGGNTSYVHIVGTMDVNTGRTSITYQVSAGISTTLNGGRTQVNTVNAEFVQDWDR